MTHEVKAKYENVLAMPDNCSDRPEYPAFNSKKPIEPMNYNIDYELTLYHGTSTLLLPDIRQSGLGGQDVLRKWGFHSFLREFIPLCRDQFDEYDNAVLSKLLRQEVGFANFQHGQTYLSPSKGTAARYAAINAYGSEFISEVLNRVGRVIGNKKVNSLLDNYPHIKVLITSKFDPILITINGADLFDLLTEHGKDASLKIEKIKETLATDPSKLEILHQQDNFRLASVVPFSHLKVEMVKVFGSVSGFPMFEIEPYNEVIV